jgi:hypothetical protein
MISLALTLIQSKSTTNEKSAKKVRDNSHASKVGDELIIDIEHYRRHPKSDNLWCVIYDPELYISNPGGMISDLEGNRSTPDGSVNVKVIIVGAKVHNKVINFAPSVPVAAKLRRL